MQAQLAIELGQNLISIMNIMCFHLTSYHAYNIIIVVVVDEAKAQAKEAV